jgi:hypothetical protein
VVAIAPNDVWAVGFDDILVRHGGETTPRTLIEHWDGRSWSLVPSPNVGDGSDLQSVSAVSGTDIWAVGASYRGFGERARSRALVEHWDGTAWTIVPGPTIHSGQPTPSIDTVAAIDPNDIWVAGRYVFRWNGTVWSPIPSPGPILALAARGPREVWAAGDSLSRWDGRNWRKVSVGPGLPKESTYNAVGVTRTGVVWTVGGLGYLEGHQHPFSFRRCAGSSAN